MMRSTIAALFLILLPTAVDAQETRDCAQCPEMVSLPAGAFVMGATPDENDDDYGSSKPQVRVTLSNAFAIGKYEVTRQEFAAFVTATGHRPLPGCFARRSDGEWERQPSLSWRNPGFAQTDRDPVVCVSSADARAYAEWLRRITGRNYRLPTEAEWEYAARGGSPAARYWGSDPSAACRHANGPDLTQADAFNHTGDQDYFFQCADGHVHTAPVGQFAPNAFGLYDMLGNVWEWTDDCWTTSHAGAPGTGDRRRDGDCRMRVVRGGGWNYGHVAVHAAFREGEDFQQRGGHLGFRVVRDQRVVSSGPLAMAAFLPLLIFHALAIPPFWMLFRRVGLGRWWVLIVLVPGVGFWLGLVVLACRRWPTFYRKMAPHE